MKKIMMIFLMAGAVMSVSTSNLEAWSFSSMRAKASAAAQHVQNTASAVTSSPMVGNLLGSPIVTGLLDQAKGVAQQKAMSTAQNFAQTLGSSVGLSNDTTDMLLNAGLGAAGIPQE